MSHSRTSMPDSRTPVLVASRTCASWWCGGYKHTHTHIDVCLAHVPAARRPPRVSAACKTVDISVVCGTHAQPPAVGGGKEAGGPCCPGRTASSSGLYRGLKATVNALSTIRPLICVPKSGRGLGRQGAGCQREGGPGKRESAQRHHPRPARSTPCSTLQSQRSSHPAAPRHRATAPSCPRGSSTGRTARSTQNQKRHPPSFITSSYCSTVLSPALGVQCAATQLREQPVGRRCPPAARSRR